MDPHRTPLFINNSKFLSLQLSLSTIHRSPQPYNLYLRHVFDWTASVHDIYTALLPPNALTTTTLLMIPLSNRDASFQTSLVFELNGSCSISFCCYIVFWMMLYPWNLPPQIGSRKSEYGCPLDPNISYVKNRGSALMRKYLQRCI
jgi:hypothetical protein